MPSAVRVPDRISDGDFADFQAPASGSTDNGKAWKWNSSTLKFEPATFLLASAVSSFGLTLIDELGSAIRNAEQQQRRAQ